MTRRVLLVIGALAAVTIACGDAAEVPSSPVRLGSPLVADAPSTTPRPSTTPAAMTDPPAPSPTQPAAPAEWTKAERIAKGSCYGISAAVDDAGTAHIAATCGTGITYVTGHDGEWIADRLAAPEGYDERGPQLALDGGHLTLGFSRYAEEDGACGGSRYIDGGVFVRSRSLPDGEWSKATRIGRREDDLEALRVRGDTVHAVALGNDGKLVYELHSGDTERRFSVGDADLSMSLRVGNDGRARLASAGGDAVRYGRFTGDGFAWERIPGTTNAYDPLLVLGAGDEANVVWTRDSEGRGCAAAARGDRDGTYYATNATGSWVIDRISKSVGRTSFTVDPKSGRVHLVIFDNRARYFTTSGDGDWTSTRIPATSAYDVVIRQDPASGGLLVAYAVPDEDAEPGGIFALTKD